VNVTPGVLVPVYGAVGTGVVGFVVGAGVGAGAVEFELLLVGAVEFELLLGAGATADLLLVELVLFEA
jgi:hypothetical protein